MFFVEGTFLYTPFLTLLQSSSVALSLAGNDHSFAVEKSPPSWKTVHHVCVDSRLGGLLPEATPTNDGLMSKYKAVMQLTNSSWNEITGEGTFIVSLEHPIKPFASMYICILNGFSSVSSAVVSGLFVGSESSLKIKSKQEGSKTPKVYVKSNNYEWVKIIPLSGNIFVKITTDVVE